jgi:hypothetical protein
MTHQALTAQYPTYLDFFVNCCKYVIQQDSPALAVSPPFNESSRLSARLGALSGLGGKTWLKQSAVAGTRTKRLTRSFTGCRSLPVRWRWCRASRRPWRGCRTEFLTEAAESAAELVAPVGLWLLWVVRHGRCGKQGGKYVTTCGRSSIPSPTSRCGADGHLNRSCQVPCTCYAFARTWFLNSRPKTHALTVWE